MARKVQVQLVDDIDGTEAVETVRFGLDGKNYQIDLSAENAKELRDSLAGFVESARRDTTGRSARPSAAASDRQRTQEIRAWAQQNGHELSDRGRIPGNVIEAYERATA
jgi:hypothetical protein